MKILSPLDSAAEVDVLVDAGAGEFYCGLLDERWHESYPVISLNRRPAGKGHFRSFADLTEAVKRAHDRCTQVYFTLNEHYYTDEQYTLLWHYIDGAIKAGVDAFIVTDFGLIASLHEKGIQVPASSVFSSGENEPFYVWVIDENAQTAHRREVKLGKLTSTGIRIQTGLKPGEWVASAGVHSIREGQKVRILTEAGKEGSK